MGANPGGPSKIVPTAGLQRRAVEFHHLDAMPRLGPREEIVQGLVAPGEIVALIGSPGGGKSACTTLLACCVAEGRSFLGRTVLRGTVLYIAAERFREITRRLIATRKKPAPIYVADARPELSNPAAAAALGQQIASLCDVERLRPSLVIIDTLARCMPGLDENSARDAGLVIEGLSRLAAACPSAAILFVHHIGKGGGGMRGSSALLGGVDLELTVDGAALSKRIKVSKANAVPEDQRLCFDLHAVEFTAEPGAAVEIVVTAVPAEDDNGAPNEARLSPRTALALKLIQGYGPKAERRSCLAAAREAQIVVGKSPASTAETFRKILVELSDARLITFDEATITVVGAEA